MDPITELAWNILVELRKEILEAQRIRAQIVGFKITFASAGIGVIVANHAPSELLVIPAFAAIFFDQLISSYGISIKRKGFYCRAYIEPKLRHYSRWPTDEPLWEEFMSRRANAQRQSLVGHLGITSLAVAVAAAGLALSSRPWLSIGLGTLLAIFLILDLVAYLRSRWIVEAATPGWYR